jgi:tetratricopeptide (TPR) repeat protein
MPELGQSHPGESCLARLRHSIIIAFAMIIPPILSLERMERTCKRLIASSARGSVPRSCLADTYRFYNRNEAACLEYEELCKLGPLSAQDRMKFAEVLFRLKNFGKVVEISEEVVAARPKDRNANWYLAMSLMETGHYGRAAEYFQRTITAGNKRFEDYWRLGFCLVKAGFLQEALAAYKGGLIVNPESTGLRNSVIWVESKLRQVSETEPAPGDPIRGNGTPPQPPAW